MGDTHVCGNEANDIAGNGHNHVRRDDIRHAIERCPVVGAYWRRRRKGGLMSDVARPGQLCGRSNVQVTQLPDDRRVASVSSTEQKDALQ